MNVFYANAYLDDYNLINLTLSKRICNGISKKFHLILDDEIIELTIVEHKDRKDSVDYKLSFDKQIVIGQPYEVMMVNGYTVPLTYRMIVKTERFNEEFYYDGSDLGAVVKDDKTSFKVWAPTASEVIISIGDKLYRMNRKEKGIYSLTFKGDLSGNHYYYIVTVNGETTKTIDPYAKASTANSKESVVVNIGDCHKETKIPNNPIVYELQVRDFSKDATFASLENEIGYLKELGITDVQLLPVNDFGSVNEYHKSEYYNWGYDPVQYQCLEGSYSTDPKEPFRVINEFRHLVHKVHEANIRVILDVVFNHHYYAERSSFNNLVPYYYFRFDERGHRIDGTGCGSECDSAQLMCRKYIIDTLCFYVAKYDIDGFRFDLMNFIDVETINLALQAVTAIKPGVVFYGEGWKIKAGAPFELLAHYDNSDKVPYVGFFNDRFRDVVKGSTFDMLESGYGSGNIWMAHEAIEVLRGERFFRKNQSINYTECHDNATIYDKLKACCKNETEQQLKDRVKIINGMTLLGQGISFLHAGQEHCTTKKGLHNTYNGPEEANKITAKDREKYKDVVEFTKAVIKIKKDHRIGINDEYEIYEDKGVVIYRVSGITVVINPSINSYKYELKDENKLICDMNGACDVSVKEQITLPPISMYILESVK